MRCPSELLAVRSQGWGGKKGKRIQGEDARSGSALFASGRLALVPLWGCQQQARSWCLQWARSYGWEGHITCHVSCVTGRTSCVMCHMSYVML